MSDITTRDLTEAPEPQYIINTPSGYFVHWVVKNTIAHLATDRKAAKEMSGDEAAAVVRELKRLNIASAKIEVNP